MKKKLKAVIVIGLIVFVIGSIFARHEQCYSTWWDNILFYGGIIVTTLAVLLYKWDPQEKNRFKQVFKPLILAGLTLLLLSIAGVLVVWSNGGPFSCYQF